MEEQALNVTIREFTPEDVDAIYRLEQLCFGENFKLEYHELLEVLRHPDVVAYVLENEAQVLVGSFYLKLEKFKNQFWILALNVDPQWRRHGFGRKMMETIFHMAGFLRIGEVVVQFESTNSAAIPFFANHGFQEKRRLENYMNSGEEGIEMTLSF